MSDLPGYALDDIVEIDSPGRLKAAADPVRALILDLVLEGPMSITTLAGHVGRAKGTVAHHVRVLVDAGLLKIVGERKVRAVVERLYGRTARTIRFTQGRPDEPLPFLSQAQAEVDVTMIAALECGECTLRHARIPPERAAEFAERINALALDFIHIPRGGDVEFGFVAALYPTNRLAARRERRKGTHG